MKIEEWPSRAKWGQAGPNRTKWCQMVPNRVKRGQKGQKKTSRGQTGPKGATGLNEAKWAHIGLFFFSYLATQALRQKLAELWGFC